MNLTITIYSERKELSVLNPNRIIIIFLLNELILILGKYHRFFKYQTAGLTTELYLQVIIRKPFCLKMELK